MKNEQGKARKGIVAGATAALLAVSMTAAAAPPKYRIVDFGSFSPSAPHTMVAAVNNHGQASGSSIVNGEFHAFFWENGTLTDIGLCPQFYLTASYGQEISNSGLVVVYCQSQGWSGEDEGFFWKASTRTVVSTFGAYLSFPEINDKDQALMTLFTPYDSAAAGCDTYSTDLYSGCRGFGLNNAGIAVGSAELVRTFVEKPFKSPWNGGPLEFLPLPAVPQGTASGVAYDINNGGAVLGAYWAEVNGQLTPATTILWETGKIKTIPGEFRKLNDSGNAVGPSGLLYQGAGYSLAGLIDASDPLRSYFTNLQAVDLNDLGWIAANATDQRTGQPRGLLLVPIDQSAAAPVVDPVAGDNIINASEAAAGVTVSGQAEPLATVTLKLGAVTKTANASGSGRFEKSFSASNIGGLPQGNNLLTAYQKDRAGNLSPVTTRTIVKDTVAPTKPTINAVTADNIATLKERSLGLTISGKAAAGQVLAVQVATINKPATASSTGVWSIALTATQAKALPVGTATVRATARDSAGNTAVGSKSFTVAN